jgi:hypothetical protein
MKNVYLLILLIVTGTGIYFLSKDIYKAPPNAEIKTISSNENESYFDLQLRNIDFPKELMVRIKKDIKNKIIPKEAVEMAPFELKPIRNSTLSDTNYLQKGKTVKKIEYHDRKTVQFEIPDMQWNQTIKKYSEKRNPSNKRELSVNSHALLDMGVTKLMRKDFKKAEQAFLTVINKFSTSDIESTARVFLIETLKQQKKITEATRAIKAAYEKYKDNDHYVNLLDRFKIVFTKEIISQTLEKKEQSQSHSITKNLTANKPTKTFPGDLNHDGILSEKDSLCAYELALSICPTSCGNDCNIKSCDINGDKKCTGSDAICIYNKALGLPCLNKDLPGDMDKDGVLTESDVLCAHELSLSICPTSCGESCSIERCDVNADNKCTDEDVICIYKRSLDLECP